MLTVRAIRRLYSTSFCTASANSYSETFSGATMRLMDIIAQLGTITRLIMVG